jgi:hypothetical protein
MPSPLDFTLSFAAAVAVGIIVLLLGTKIIAGLRLPFGNAFWMSFIAHIFTSVISLGFGLVLAYHLGLALILGTALGFYVQAFLFQTAIRAAGQTLPAGQAYILLCSSFLLISLSPRHSLHGSWDGFQAKTVQAVRPMHPVQPNAMHAIRCACHTCHIPSLLSPLSPVSPLSARGGERVAALSVPLRPMRPNRGTR